MTALLTSMIDDTEAQWRSQWLRVCALYVASIDGIPVHADRAALEALGDPDVTELLASTFD